MTSTKNRKVLLVPMLLVIALLVAGYAYADWTQTLYIDGTVTTCELDWEFEPGTFTSKDVGIDWTADTDCSPPSITDIRQLDKDVGSTTGEFEDTDADGDLDKLKVTIDNAYPCYYNHIDFWVHNNGKMPLIIWKVIIDSHEYTALPAILCLDLDGDLKNDIIIRYGDSFGAQLEECESANISFDFHILQEAPQGETLSFTIEIVAIQWNKY